MDYSLYIMIENCQAQKEMKTNRDRVGVKRNKLKSID